MRSPSVCVSVCLCVCMRIPLILLISNARSNLYETWYEYHDTRYHLRGVIHKTFPIRNTKIIAPQIAEAKPNIALTAVPVFMKLGTYALCHMKATQRLTSTTVQSLKLLL
jgi:hypothetical protein